VDFSKPFSRGAKSGEICFLTLESKKTAILAELFKFLPLFRHPCLCGGKVRATPLKNWSNFKRSNTIANSGIAESYTQHEIFGRSIPTVLLVLHWKG